MRPAIATCATLVLGAMSLVGDAEVAHAKVCDDQLQLSASSAELIDVWRKVFAETKRPEGDALDAAASFARQHLLRPQNQERASTAALAHYRALDERLTPAQRRQVDALLDETGLMTPTPPPQVPIDYVLLNGSAAPSVRRRIASLCDAFERGALTLSRTAQIVFLGGERALFATETPAVLLDPAPYPVDPHWRAPKELPHDERGLNELLWQQFAVPQELRKRGILFIHAQKRPDAARAETRDCVEAWAKTHPLHHGVVLVVSNGPFVEYQQRITRVLLAEAGLQPDAVVAMGDAADFSSVEPLVRRGLLLDTWGQTLGWAVRERAALGKPYALPPVQQERAPRL